VFEVVSAKASIDAQNLEHGFDGFEGLAFHGETEGRLVLKVFEDDVLNEVLGTEDPILLELSINLILEGLQHPFLSGKKVEIILFLNGELYHS
jgi:hypothetical protein